MGQRKKKVEQQQSKRGRSCARFFGERKQEKKLRRILKSSGPEAARLWAEKSGALPILKKIAKDGDHKTARLASEAFKN